MQEPPQPPDNLPVEPSCRSGHRPSDGPLLRRGSFSLSPKELRRFRALLARHVGEPLPWNEEELERVAYQAIEAAAALLAFHRKHRDASP